ncbi:hypothetical protein NUW54_g14017 [Trametes sanguinea]|uniref:Uncharacterized protein n=1 Tax=Trametes sanguinea TaxID=158606 RepID=A0ACC1MFE4_9APHY|nr:hypothetical protein NUW54_g14017 [Trametes sanguinea]
MLFKTYGFVPMYQTLYFMNDLKIGHYMKIPPRIMFMAQLIPSTLACFICVGVQQWQFAHIPDMCMPWQKDGFVCNDVSTFATASIIWGGIGPKRLFGSGQMYVQLGSVRLPHRRAPAHPPSTSLPGATPRPSTATSIFPSAALGLAGFPVPVCWFLLRISVHARDAPTRVTYSLLFSTAVLHAILYVARHYVVSTSGRSPQYASSYRLPRILRLLDAALALDL